MQKHLSAPVRRLDLIPGSEDERIRKTRARPISPGVGTGTVGFRRAGWLQARAANASAPIKNYLPVTFGNMAISPPFR